MAKKSLVFSYKGELDAELFQITEIGKEEEKTYDILEVLKQMDGKTVTFSIKEDSEPMEVRD